MTDFFRTISNGIRRLIDDYFTGSEADELKQHITAADATDQLFETIKQGGCIVNNKKNYGLVNPDLARIYNAKNNPSQQQLFDVDQDKAFETFTAFMKHVEENKDSINTLHWAKTECKKYTGKGQQLFATEIIDNHIKENTN